MVSNSQYSLAVSFLRNKSEKGLRVPLWGRSSVRAVLHSCYVSCCKFSDASCDSCTWWSKISWILKRGYCWGGALIAPQVVIVIAAGGTKYLEFWKSHCLELHCLLFQLSRQDFEKLPSLATNTIVDWLSSSNMRMRMTVIIQYDEDDDDHLLWGWGWSSSLDFEKVAFVTEEQCARPFLGSRAIFKFNQTFNTTLLPSSSSLSLNKKIPCFAIHLFEMTAESSSSSS